MGSPSRSPDILFAPAYPLRVIDTHCHLTFPDFAGRTAAILDQARDAGVTGAITVSTTTRDCLDALALARSHHRLWCSAGVHPLYSDRSPHEWENLALVARDQRCVAWGELGLDNHYERPDSPTQRRVLREQLEFIQACHARPRARTLPVILHCREAFADLVPILRATTLDPTRFVFHCFTGTPDDARLALDFGAMISFTGVVTYRNAPEVREAARLVPLDRIMVETDAPFLSPEPKRGTRPCTPALVRLTAEALAELRAEPWDSFHQAVNDNTRRFFAIDAD